MQGNIFVNGFPLDEVREWYISNTGYVLQLATPYYAELTVRDNLTLAAQITLGRMISRNTCGMAQRLISVWFAT